MLILPPGHFQEVNRPRRRTLGERWMVATGGLLTVAVVAVALFALTSHRASSGHGCLHFTYAMVMGGEEFNACGTQARHYCTSPPRLGGLAHDFEVRLRTACRQAGLPTKTH